VETVRALLVLRVVAIRLVQGIHVFVQGGQARETFPRLGHTLRLVRGPLALPERLEGRLVLLCQSLLLVLERKSLHLCLVPGQLIQGLCLLLGESCRLLLELVRCHALPHALLVLEQA